MRADSSSVALGGKLGREIGPEDAASPRFSSGVSARFEVLTIRWWGRPAQLCQPSWVAGGKTAKLAVVKPHFSAPRLLPGTFTNFKKAVRMYYVSGKDPMESCVYCGADTFSYINCQPVCPKCSDDLNHGRRPALSELRLQSDAAKLQYVLELIARRQGQEGGHHCARIKQGKTGV